ncbi:HEPN domain-containing protein [Sphingopyxis granuli]|uniref:HEPN domain-containing protein n=1 Tax=Sphingopyxis granuli TaxID=267128 RepID=UPI00301DDF32
MRTNLDHLPQSKQRELAHVVRVLFEEFEAAHTMGTSKWKKQARVFKIVLYGSYARGDWVDDPVGGYKSDYDLLIVVNDDRLTDFEVWSAAEDRLMREVTINNSLTAPVSFIVHTLTDVNAQLERGRPFFVDIVAQGIALYEAEGYEFAQPRNLPVDEARVEAEKHFERWFATAQRSRRTYKLQRAEGDDVYWRNKSVFELHQATEQLYHCLLLTLTLYSPKSHRLNFLRSQCEQIAPALIEAWPRGDKFSRRCFELLRLAYVNACYSPSYEITAEELGWIGERVSVLEGLVETICRDHLAGLQGADRAAE